MVCIEKTPVILFAYNRPEHTKETLKALKNNTLANKTDLYIYIDGPRDSSQISKVNEVYNLVSNVDGFKSVEIIRNESNKGLANSIIDGVSSIINKYGSVIVLEDDLITSKYFLSYMNEAIKLYKDENRIWSISGYTPKIMSEKNKYDKDIYLSVRGCSWGWATWKDRWDTIDWDVNDYIMNRKNKDVINGFNKGGNDLIPMIEDYINSRINSWAIRWVYNQFNQSRLTVYPTKSLVINIGLDFSGTHSSNSQKYNTPLYQGKISLTKDIELDEQISKSFKQFYDLNFKGYLGVLTRKIGIYRTARKIQKLFNW